MTTYCNITTDLIRAYARIDDFKEMKTLRGWVVYSGSVYSLSNTGYVSQLFQGGIQLTAVASIATVAAGKYYYDANTDTLYAQSTTGLVTSYVMQSGEDWDALKTWAITEASGIVDAMLDGKFPVPIPENPDGSSTLKWDAPLVDACALMACSKIAGRREPPKFNPDGTGGNITADLMLAGRSVLKDYIKGDLKFSWELTKDEIGGTGIIGTSGNTSIGMFQLQGTYNGADEDYWMLKIAVGGALGTATYQLSYDNGTTYETAVTTLTTNLWQTLASGIEIRFFSRGGGASSFIANDTWQIVLTPKTKSLSSPKIGTIDLIA
jgi:hypothetical protein